MVVLAVDPGRRKCGIAVLRAGVPPTRLCMAVVPTETVVEYVLRLVREHGVTHVVVGDSTGGQTLLREIAASLPVSVEAHCVPERNTTQQARRLYWRENPPAGLCRLIPVSLQTPPRPWDDYAALLLAEEAAASTIF